MAARLGAGVGMESPPMSLSVVVGGVLALIGVAEEVAAVRAATVVSGADAWLWTTYVLSMPFKVGVISVLAIICVAEIANKMLAVRGIDAISRERHIVK